MTEHQNQPAVQFLSNVPVEVALKWTDGKIVQGMYGERVMFTLTDGRKMFVDGDVAARVHMLEPVPGEPIIICKQRPHGRGASTIWKVYREGDNAQPRTAAGESALERDLRNSLNVQARPQVTSRPPAPNISDPAPRPPAPPPPVTQAPAANGNGHKPAAVPVKATYGAAMTEFLLLAGRATREVEKILGAEGGSVRFDSRDVCALATTLVIQAAREGFLVYKPGESETI
jgi:hypothetical protein